MDVLSGSTDVTQYFAMTLLSNGLEATALTLTDFDFQYTRYREEPSTKVDATALTDQDDAHADNKVIEIDSATSKGLHRTDWPDAAFAAGVPLVILTVSHPLCYTEHMLVVLDPQVDVRKWKNQTVPTPNQTGVPISDIGYIGGTGAGPVGTVSADITSINSDSDAAIMLALLFKSMIKITVDNATFTPTTTTFETDQTADDPARYFEQVLFGMDGNNKGFTAAVTAYAFANGKVKLTVETLPAAPANGHRFIKIGRIEQ